MDKRLKESLLGQTENYILPFYWLKGQPLEQITADLQRIYDCGIRAVCIEARPHPDFCGEGWWRDMDTVLGAAERLGMQVWILDDDHFPTGHANGAIGRKYPDLRAWHIAETHIDVMGPTEGTFLIRRYLPQDEVLGIFAYRRGEGDKELFGEPMECLLSECGNWGEFSLPEGCWRIFTLLKTRKNIDDYIDMLRPESVRVLIREVYEAHYARYSHLFGRVIAGFFSDEPRFGNNRVGQTEQHIGYYNNRLGIPGMGYPWSETLGSMLWEKLGTRAYASLPLLWYSAKGEARELRAQYMDLVSELYAQAFSQQVGEWCRTHGVRYIGHIIEDNNTHARLGSSAGHYFRAMRGQDMAGIDVVLHCILPGFAHYDSASRCEGGWANAAFYHYVLAQLAASDAALDPKKQGNSMCEIFGAYGWAEDLPMMKWLTDFFLVRGINHFVPHAFSPCFPDCDCPPHFGGGGIDPQWEGFGILMRYMNRMCHVLSEGERIRNVAVLYHAEAEWANGTDYMSMEVPCRELYDRHICYDIVPADLLEGATVEQGQICISGIGYQCLVVPSAPYLSERVAKALIRLHDKGGTVLAVNSLPKNAPMLSVVPLGSLADRVLELGCGDVEIRGTAELLRHLHLRRGADELYFFFNESTVGSVDACVRIPQAKSCLAIDLLQNRVLHINPLRDGSYPLELAPYQSVLYVFGQEARELTCEEFLTKPCVSVPLRLHWSISLADCDTPEEFVFYRRTDVLPNLTGIKERPNFSGYIRYEAELELSTLAPTMCLELGRVGSVAKLSVNGVDCGTCICEPYVFSIGNALRVGNNKLTVVVANTLVHRLQDSFSKWLPIRPSGMLGPVTLKQIQ